MRPTLRRLNDRERYWGMTWPGWAAAASCAGLLYAAIRLSPFAVKPTVTVAVLLLAVAGMVVAGVSGQALSPGRQLRAIVAYRRSPKRWTLAAPDERGVVLAHAPALDPREPGHEPRADAFPPPTINPGSV